MNITFNGTQPSTDFHLITAAINTSCTALGRLSNSCDVCYVFPSRNFLYGFVMDSTCIVGVVIARIVFVLM